MKKMPSFEKLKKLLTSTHQQQITVDTTILLKAESEIYEDTDGGMSESTKDSLYTALLHYVWTEEVWRSGRQPRSVVCTHQKLETLVRVYEQALEGKRWNMAIFGWRF